MSPANQLIENAKRVRQRLRYPPNAVMDHGIDLTRKSTAHKGSEPVPEKPVKKTLKFKTASPYPEVQFLISFENILDAVASHYKISIEDLKGSSRKHYLCYARFVVVHLSMRFLTTKSMSSIARSLNKDHTSILHARDRINGILAENPLAKAEVGAIGERIETLYNCRYPLSTDGQFYMAL